MERPPGVDDFGWDLYLLCEKLIELAERYPEQFDEERPEDPGWACDDCLKRMN